MMVLLVGGSQLAGDFAIACEHGARDYVWINGRTSNGLDSDQLKALLLSAVDQHGVNAIVSATVPFDEAALAKVSHTVASERDLPIVVGAIEGHVKQWSFDPPATVQTLHTVLDLASWVRSVEQGRRDASASAGT